MSVYKNPFYTLKTISINLWYGRTLNRGPYKLILLRKFNND